MHSTDWDHARKIGQQELEALDLAVQRALSANADNIGPTQAGPLALYPTFALVDPQQRWQRIQQWALQDSHTAAVASNQTTASMRHASGAGWASMTGASSHQQDVHSLSASMLELEQQRAHRSLPASPAAQQLPRSTTRPAGDQGSLGRPQAAQPGAGVTSSQMLASSMTQLLNLLEAAPPAHVGRRATVHAGQPSSAAAAVAGTAVQGTHATHAWHTESAHGNTSRGLGSIESVEAAAHAYDRSTSAVTQSQEFLTSALQALQHSTVVDQERAHLRQATLEAALSSERALAARLQAELATELARSAAAADAESQCRQALAQATKALETEKRRSQELKHRSAVEADKAAVQVDSLGSRCASLESRLHQEKEACARVQRKLAASTKAVSQLESEVQRSEASRIQTAARLEAAASQVASMRSELSHLRSSLSAREKQLTAHLQELEATQLAELQQQLEASQEVASHQQQVLAAIGAPLLSLAQCLHVQPLAAALHLQPERLVVFSASAEQHRCLVERLAGMMDCISEGDSGAGAGGGAGPQEYARDVAALATRVRELLSAVQQVCLHAERAEVAAASENDAQLSELEAQLTRLQAHKDQQAQDHAAREAGLTQALRTSTSRVEELLVEVDQLNTQLTASQAAAQANNNAHMRQLHEQVAQGAIHAAGLAQDVSTWQARALQAERKLVDSSAGATQLQELVEAKEARLVELRQALAQAHDTAALADAARAHSVSSGHAALEDLVAQLTTATAAAAAAQTAQAQLQQQLAAYKADQSCVEDTLRSQVASLHADCDGTKAQLQACTQQLNAMMSALRAAGQQVLGAVPADLARSGQPGFSGPAARALPHLCDQLRQLCLHEDEDSTAGVAAADSLTALGAFTASCIHSLQDCQQALPHMITCQAAVHEATTLLAGFTSLLHGLVPPGGDVSGQVLGAHQDLGGDSNIIPSQAASALTLSMQVLLAQVRHVTAGTAALSTTCTERAAQAAELQQQLAHVQMVADKQLETSRQSLDQQLHDAHSQYEHTKAQWSAALAKLRVAEKDVRALQAILVALQHQQTGADMRASSAQQAAAALQQQLVETNHQWHSVQEANTALEGTVRRLSRQARLANFRYRLASRRLAAHQASGQNLRLSLQRARHASARQAAAVQAAEAALSREQSKAATASATMQSQQARQQRADALVTKLEERRASLEADKRVLADKLAAAVAKASAAEHALAAAHKGEAATRQEHQRSLRAATQRCAAAEARATTLLEALEGAEMALRESQANSTRLLQLASLQSGPEGSAAMMALARELVGVEHKNTQRDTTPPKELQPLESCDTPTRAAAAPAFDPPGQHDDLTPGADQPADGYGLGVSSSQRSSAHSGALQATIMQLHAEVDRLHAELHTAALETATARAAELAAKAQCTELLQDIQQTTARSQADTVEAQALQEAREKEVQAAGEVVQQLRASHLALELEVAAQQRDKAAVSERHATTLDLLHTSDEALQASVNKCNTLEAVLQSQAEELQHLREELDKLSAAADADAQQAMLAVNEAEEHKSAAVQTLDSLQAQLGAALEERDNAVHAAAAAASKQQSLEHQLASMATWQSAMQEQLEAEQHQAAEARGHAAQVQSEMERLQGTVVSLQAELQACSQHWVGKLQALQAKGQQDVQALHVELERAQQSVQQHQEQLELQARQLSELRVALDSAQCEVQACHLEQCALQCEHEARQLSAASLHHGVVAAQADHMTTLSSKEGELQQAQDRVRQLEVRLEEAAEREASYGMEVASARHELHTLTQQLGLERAHNNQLRSELEGVLQQLVVIRSQQHAALEDDMESVSTMTGLTGRTVRLEQASHDVIEAASLLADNQALMDRLQRTHGKLKLARARIVQLEAALELGSQAALKAAQEEAALAMAQCAAAQQQAEALAQRCQEGHSKGGSKGAVQALLPAAVAASQEEDAGSTDDGSRDQHATTLSGSDSEPDYDTKAILQLIRNQHREIRTLQEALSKSHAKRAQDVRQAAEVADDLAAAQRQVRELESAVSAMEHQLRQAEASTAGSRHHPSSQESAPLDDQQPTQESDASAIVGPCLLGPQSLRLAEQVSQVWRDASAAHTARIAWLEGALRVADHDLQYTHQQLMEAQNKADSYQARVELLESAMCAHTAQSQLDMSAMEQQVVQAESQRQSLSEQLMATQHVCEELQRRSEGLGAALQAAQVKRQQDDASRLQLCQELERSAAVNKDLDNEKRVLAKQLSKIKRDLAGALFTATQQLPAQATQLQGSEDWTMMMGRVRTALATGNETATAVNMQLQEARADLQQRTLDIAALNARVSSQAARISEQASELSAAREALAVAEAKLQRKEAELRTVEAEISRQLDDYGKLRARLLTHEQDSNRLSTGHEAMARKCDELHAALAAKQADCASAQAKVAAQQEHLTVMRNNLIEAQERLRATDVSQQLRSREQHHTEQLLQELTASQEAVLVLKQQLERKMGEVRELHQMLKAWEAMRLGKDAQIAALMERCKRHEEDAAEKARTVEALRKKVSAIGRDSPDSPSSISSRYW